MVVIIFKHLIYTAYIPVKYLFDLVIVLFYSFPTFIYNIKFMTKGKKVISIISVIVLLILVGIGYYRYFFVFGEGVKAGELNYVVRKGYIFKTYEGKLIQSGIKSRQTGTLQNNEFEFSIANKDIADKMMANSGKFYELHYKEYKNTLPWRGFSVYVVDSILTSKDIPQ
ncbi:hypothetical protein ACFOG5_09485 [Pedobacter fastidiosus]